MDSSDSSTRLSPHAPRIARMWGLVSAAGPDASHGITEAGLYIGCKYWSGAWILRRVDAVTHTEAYAAYYAEYGVTTRLPGGGCLPAPTVGASLRQLAREREVSLRAFETARRAHTAPGEEGAALRNRSFGLALPAGAYVKAALCQAPTCADGSHVCADAGATAAAAGGMRPPKAVADAAAARGEVWDACVGAFVPLQPASTATAAAGAAAPSVAGDPTAVAASSEFVWV